MLLDATMVRQWYVQQAGARATAAQLSYVQGTNGGFAQI